MSLSKRILFGDDPADREARARLDEQTCKHLEQFKFKIPTRRRNRSAIGGYWDAIWPGSLQSAKELNMQTVQINSQLCTARDASQMRARLPEFLMLRHGFHQH